MLSIFLLPVVFQTPMPPFKKAFNVSVQEMYGNQVAAGDTVYLGNWGSYQKRRADTGKLIWQVPLPKNESEANVFLDGKRLFVITGGEKPGRIMQVNPETGKALWTIHRGPGYPGETLIAGRYMFTEGPYEVVTCFDLNSRAIRWTRNLAQGRQGGINALALDGERLLVGIWHGRLVALDAKTGKPAWQRNFAGTNIPLNAAAQGVTLAGGDKSPLLGLRSRDGQQLWKLPDLTDCLGAKVIGKGAFVAHGKKLDLMDMRTGKAQWSLELPEPVSELSPRAPFVSNTLYARSQGLAYAISDHGNLAWKWPIEDDGMLFSVRKDGFALYGDYTRGGSSSGYILCLFTQGEPPKLPQTSSDRKALATKLLSRFGELNVDEHRDLEKLGRDAFEPIVERFKLAALEYAKKQESTGGSKWYGEVEDLAQLLAGIATPADTEGLLTVANVLPKNSHGRFRLLGVIVAKGDPHLYTQTMLEILQTQNPDPSYTWTEAQVEMEGVMRSSEPAAIDFMINRLNDESADDQVRQMAYTTLPLHGGEKGREAVRRFRSTERALPPLSELMELADVPAKPPAKGQRSRGSSELLDVSGELGLIRNSVYGSYYDLFVARRTNDRWSEPVFSGVTSMAPERSSAEERKKVEAKRKALIDDGGWKTQLANLSTLALDTDKDGLTDLAEVRLGTDPKVADTDQDGLLDSQDRNPLVAPRELTEEEVILWTAFEARYRFDEHGTNPFLVTFPGRPFELLGSGGYVLPADRAGTVKSLFGLGPGFIRLEAPQGTGDTRVVNISTTYAGLNGTGYRIVLRKFGKEWFVIDSHMTWIS